MARITTQGRAAAGHPRPLLLVFDTFKMRDLEEQFWERFLPDLHGTVLVVLSSRSSPQPDVPSPGWRMVVDEIVLTPLPDEAARRWY